MAFYPSLRIQDPIHLNVGGEKVKRVHEVKYLEDSVDESLSWIAQFKKLKTGLENPSQDKVRSSLQGTARE